MSTSGNVNNNSGSRRFCENILDQLNYIVNNVEPFDKLTKITHKTINLVSAITGKVSFAFEQLASNLKGTTDVIESLSLIGRIKELACPDQHGKYFLQKNNNVKCADRIFLTAASVFKTINAAAKLALLNLGKLAKLAIGRVPVMKVIPESLVAISSFFSVWDNRRVSKDVNAKLAVINAKVEKWAGRDTLISEVRKGNHWSILELKNKYAEAVPVLEKEIKGTDVEQGNTEQLKKVKTLTKYRERLSLIAANEYDKLATELAKPNISLKHKQWTDKQAVQDKNLTKAWYGVANGISKICVITFAISTTALGLSTTPWVISLTAASICADGLSLAKSLYENSLKKA